MILLVGIRFPAFVAVFIFTTTFRPVLKFTQGLPNEYIWMDGREGSIGCKERGT
jgi:hypothetical protein